MDDECRYNVAGNHWIRKNVSKLLGQLQRVNDAHLSTFHNTFRYTQKFNSIVQLWNTQLQKPTVITSISTFQKIILVPWLLETNVK